MSDRVMVISRGIPSEPEELKLTISSQSISVSWSAPVSNGGAEIQGYLVYRGSDPEKMSLYRSVGPNTFRIEDEDLDSGPRYYEVIAYNEVGEGRGSMVYEDIPSRVMPGLIVGLVSAFVPLFLAVLLSLVIFVARKLKGRKKVKEAQPVPAEPSVVPAPGSARDEKISAISTTPAYLGGKGYDAGTPRMLYPQRPVIRMQLPPPQQTPASMEPVPYYPPSSGYPAAQGGYGDSYTQPGAGAYQQQQYAQDYQQGYQGSYPPQSGGAGYQQQQYAQDYQQGYQSNYPQSGGPGYQEQQYAQDHQQGYQGNYPQPGGSGYQEQQYAQGYQQGYQDNYPQSGGGGYQPPPPSGGNYPQRGQQRPAKEEDPYYGGGQQ
jgi:hypothetical protein